ncbi:MAG: TatD family hydrolase [Candidatus Eisenbacteria bacterium]|uniref:TatD family hydrolase n=1 Tax=Eiseniibacteriota bacterium TaxID=2212470 RepID=A0A938BPX5_UNCEI|nr:TatD family hydrolase [Candidatus Eisenbacteria bacterium]
MIDTHAHLHLPDFDGDRDRVIARAFALGLDALIEINISAGGWPAVKRLAEADARIHATLGIHPHEAGPEALRALAGLEGELASERVVAVGETGLDAARGRAPREEQVALCAAHIGLAREARLPLVLHCREAFPELLRLLDLEGRGAVRGVFHCFSGGAGEAREIAARGFHMGFGGGVTYAPERWRPVLAAVPAGRLLLETDAPFLRPAPDRRGRNEPAFLFRTAAAIARLLGLSEEETEARADANAADLFGPSVIRRSPPAPADSPDGGAASP